MAGEWVDRVEAVSLNELFDGMATAELEDYATNGVLPAWFKAKLGATRARNQEKVPYVQ